MTDFELCQKLARCDTVQALALDVMRDARRHLQLGSTEVADVVLLEYIRRHSPDAPAPAAAPTPLQVLNRVRHRLRELLEDVERIANELPPS
jgi:hypothetical protein